MSVTIKELETAGEHGDCKIIHGIRRDDIPTLTGTDGDFIAFVLNEDGILRTQAQQHRHIDECEATTGWSVLGNDTINLATTTNHVFKQHALEFDKVNGAANTVFGGIQKTLASLSLAPYEKGGGYLLYSIYLSSLSDVDYVFVRLGTDSSNYNEWRLDADALLEGWNFCRFTIASPYSSVGNGWDSAAITYIAVGAAFDAETNELADIAIDHIATNTGIMTTIPVEVAKNINLLKVKNKVVNVGAGNVGTGTQRITIATDDVNLSAIKTAIEILDNFISDTRGLVTEDNSNAIKNALEIIDDWDESDRCKVNLPTATETKLTNIVTALQVIDNFISGTRGLVTEDSGVAIKNAVELIDNAISGTEMQVDVVTSALPTGAATSAKQLADGHNVKSNNVNIATETTVNSIKTAVEIIDNFISGTRGLVTEDNSNAIKNALEIIDDWDESDRCKVNLPTATETKLTNIESHLDKLQQLILEQAEKLTAEDMALRTVTGDAINPNNIRVSDDASADFGSVTVYIEIDFGEFVKIRQYNYEGVTNQNEDGTFKIQYYDEWSLAWVDWITGIPTRLGTASGWIYVFPIVTKKIKMIATSIDTYGSIPWHSKIDHLQLKY